MSKTFSIAIDAMGGDNSPDKTIKGIKIFLDKNKSNKDFILNVFGKSEEINTCLKKYNITYDFVNVFNTHSTVSYEDTPLPEVKKSGGNN